MCVYVICIYIFEDEDLGTSRVIKWHLEGLFGSEVDVTSVEVMNGTVR